MSPPFLAEARHNHRMRRILLGAVALLALPARAREPAPTPSVVFAPAAPKASVAAPARSQWLERFDGDWQWTEPTEKNGRRDYVIATENGNRFLRAEYIVGTSGHVIYRKVTWDTKAFPYLRWRWRVNAFPKGALILDDNKSDAAAQIYVSWRIGGRNYALKYFWATQDPIGTSFHKGRWNPVGRYFGQVIRSGGATGEWVTETRNLVEDFRKAYGKDPGEEAIGLGLLTDADATKSEAKADYDDFEALSAP